MNELIIYLSFFLVALLYSTVGHGGASGYIALMSLLSFAPEQIKPTALVLNIFVSGIAFYKFYTQKYFNYKMFLSFVLASAPLAFMGGYLKLDANIYKIIVGVVLLYASIRFLFYKSKSVNDSDIKEPSLIIKLSTGSILGFISGLTGVGGGIFLSPLLLFFKWANAKQTAALSAGFILINSFTGLMGKSLNGIELNNKIIFITIATIIGGWIGSELGSKKFNTFYLMKLLGIVMLIASIKLILII